MTEPTDIQEPEKNTESQEPEKKADATPEQSAEKTSPLRQAVREIVEPFKGLANTSRSLWGLYLSYVLEGMVYFGILTIFGKYLSENVGLSDVHAGWVYSFFTGGITLSMLFLGGVADRIGVRKALLISLGLMILGRISFAASGTFFPGGGGFGSMMFLFIVIGMLFVVLGYGMYQPASYSGVKQFTDEKNASMAFAMIYGLMNLGAFFSGLLSPVIRNSLSIGAVYWVYAGSSVLAFLCVLFIMSQKAVERDTVTDISKKPSGKEGEAGEGAKEEEKPAPLFTPGFIAAAVGVIAALGGVFYLMFTSPPGPVDGPMDAFARHMGNTAGMLAPADPQKPAPAPTEEEFRKVAGEISQLADRIREPSTLPDGAKLDPEVYQAIRAVVRHQAEFAASLGALLPKLDVKAETGTPAALQVRTQVRALGLAYMSAAYRLVGNFDAKVLERIARQQKLPEEATIPIPEPVRARIMEMTSADRARMFESLAQLSEETGALAVQLLGDGVQALSQSLQLEARLLREAAQRTAGGPAAANLFVDRFYGVGTLLIKQVAPLLAAKASTPLNGTILSMHFGLQAAFSGDMKKAAENAVYVSGLTAFGSFMKRYGVPLAAVIFFTVLLVILLLRKRPDHPFHNGRFVFFIFILIPVQTLFAHNWLTLPYYIDRAFGGTYVGQNFEMFSNLNPILIFFLTPFVAALTSKVRVYTMMVWGTLVMAVPTFLLALPPSPAMLLLYILLMTIGEAMWQPRFLQWVAQIAPEGKTGAYMGIAQFPWFLTKVMTGFYSGYFLSKYCPLVGPQNPEMLWFIYGVIALVSPVALIAAARWMSRGMARSAST